MFQLTDQVFQECFNTSMTGEAMFRLSMTKVSGMFQVSHPSQKFQGMFSSTFHSKSPERTPRSATVGAGDWT